MPCRVWNGESGCGSEQRVFMGEKWEPGWKSTGEFAFHMKNPKCISNQDPEDFHTGMGYPKKCFRNINILNKHPLWDLKFF